MNKEHVIVGYYSIALKMLVLSRKLLPDKKKEIRGDEGAARRLPSFLIGQLGRSDKYTSKQLAGVDILNKAMDTIKKVNNLIGGRLVFLECQNIEKLLDFYNNNNFTFLQMHSNKENLAQMIRMLV